MNRQGEQNGRRLAWLRFRCRLQARLRATALHHLFEGRLTAAIGGRFNAADHQPAAIIHHAQAGPGDGQLLVA